MDKNRLHVQQWDFTHPMCDTANGNTRKMKQDRQWMHNMTVRCVRSTIVAVEKQWVLHNLSVRICSLRYPACDAYGLCRLWPASLYSIFPHCLTNCRIFEKWRLLNTKCVFWFSLRLFYESFSFWEEMRGYDKKCIVVFM